MNRWRFAVTAVLALSAQPGFTPLAQAQAAPGTCQAHSSDHSERPAPDALLPQLGKAFGVDPHVLRGGSYVRCADGRLLGCVTGANLNCGVANTSRRSAGGDAFCRDSPGSDSVPLAATGHDTIYDWRCVGTHAVAGKALEKVDASGFMARNWRPLR